MPRSLRDPMMARRWGNPRGARRSLRTGMVVLVLALGVAGCGTRYRAPEPTVQDRAAMSDATQTALEDKATGEGLNWTNPESGHRGTVTPLRTFEDDGRPCREYQQTVTIEGTTLTGVGTACREEDGQWTTTEFTGLETVARARRYGRYPYHGRFAYGYPHYGYHPFGFHHGFHHRYPFHHRHRFHLGFGHHF